MSKFFVRKSSKGSFNVYWRDEKLFGQAFCVASFHPIKHLDKEYSPKLEAEKLCSSINEKVNMLVS